MILKQMHTAWKCSFHNLLYDNDTEYQKKIECRKKCVLFALVMTALSSVCPYPLQKMPVEDLCKSFLHIAKKVVLMVSF